MKKIARKVLLDITMVFSGCLIYLLIKFGFSISDEPIYPLLVSIIFFFALFKLMYFFLVTLEYIMRSIKREYFTFSKFLFSVMYVLILIQVSFAVDYFCILQTNKEAFDGITLSSGLWHTMFDCMYFSTITFATIGYGDIHPMIISSKALVMLESLSSMVFVVLIIANYSNLKESFQKTKPPIGDHSDLD